MSIKAEQLARAVRNELAAAGLPVLGEGVLELVAAGASVHLLGDPLVVYVQWRQSPRLSQLGLRRALGQPVDDALWEHMGHITTVMNRAITEILESAGYRVEQPDENSYTPVDLRVLDGPINRRFRWDYSDAEMSAP